MEEGLIVLLDTASSVTQHLEVGFTSASQSWLYTARIKQGYKSNQVSAPGGDRDVGDSRPPMIANSVTPNPLVRASQWNVSG